MRFKLGENLPAEVANLLSDARHDVATAVSEGLGGAADEVIWQKCVDELRAIVTLDLDFAGIRTYNPAGSPGIVVLRLIRQDVSTVVAVLRRNLALFNTEPLAGRLWIVEEGRVRIRGSESNA